MLASQTCPRISCVVAAHQSVEPANRGRIVLISYAFPPDNTSGAVRVGKFVTRLSQYYGWAVDVITPKRKSMSPQSAANQMPIPEAVSLRATRNFEIFDFVAKCRNGNGRSRPRDIRPADNQA